MAKVRGSLNWFNEPKGFGFITPGDGSKDVFVHVSAVSGTGFKVLTESQAVAFETADGAKGPSAANVVALQPFGDDPPASQRTGNDPVFFLAIVTLSMAIRSRRRSRFSLKCACKVFDFALAIRVHLAGQPHLARLAVPSRSSPGALKPIQPVVFRAGDRRPCIGQGGCIAWRPAP